MNLSSFLYWSIFIGLVILGIWTFGVIYLYYSYMNVTIAIFGAYVVGIIVGKEKELVE